MQVPACPVLGVDEAGRGPVLGPMALAVVGLSPPAARRLLDAGLRDSKAFGATKRGRARRRLLAERIVEEAWHAACVLVPAFVVDAYTERRRLDVLEREVALDLIEGAPLPRGACVVADGARLFRPLCREVAFFTARDRADAHEPAVAAASILAKVARDEAFDALLAPYEEAFGPIRGGGYANAATRRFLRAHLERHGTLPPFARRSFLRGTFLGSAVQEVLFTA